MEKKDLLHVEFEGKPPAKVLAVCCECGKEVMGEHNVYDYPELALVELPCEDCNDGFAEEDLYDDMGNWIEPERHGESLVDAVVRLRSLANSYEDQANTIRAERDELRAHLTVKEMDFNHLSKLYDDMMAQRDRLRGYLDDACECARCCECSGMIDDCKIMAAKMHKKTDSKEVDQRR